VKEGRLEQLDLWHAAERRCFAVCQVFNEIQTGPNPLSSEEIRRLIAKRPERYGVLERCAKREDQ